MIGTHDVLLLTLDALRWDVARDALAAEKTPYLAALLPDEKWQMRHSAGSFTLAAHAAFFAGFLPTPVVPGTHPRLFAARFEGSETTDEHTFVFDAPDLPRGLAMRDYYTICIGGVGFFNKRTPLGCTLPDLFQESHWNESFGVTNARSTENQVACAVEILKNLPRSQRVFLFLNISAMHQPNCIFLPGTESDSVASQAAALAYVDAHLPPLFAALQERAPLLAVVCSDHGTAYGEDGYRGHRLAHPVVWTVPYAEFVLPQTS